MGGKAAAAVIRERDKLVPIIFLTGETAAGMKESTVKYAPAQLLLKPCNKPQLIEVSAAVINSICVLHQLQLLCEYYVMVQRAVSDHRAAQRFSL
jgi:FixJ family two-component response regulator